MQVRCIATAAVLTGISAALPAAADTAHISWSAPGWYVNDDWGKSAGRANTDGLLPVLLAGPFSNQPACESNRPQWAATGQYYNVICTYLSADPFEQVNKDARAWEDMMNGN